ncbi:hypothetical protein G7085_02885 [Tessaracoccus sp. HDW20]|uniref:hypothetical protein n=1 Tax=Tessaracoccus coleopterorum TaxID=2714950 RepID=UPI0018D3D75C|nr:hypothetical protein [Tessaracoccus coleopterorum]NHB83965.1 hypothetical protein [Tessaracoccus coleopterorum]
MRNGAERQVPRSRADRRGIALLGVGLDQLVKWASVTYLTPENPWNSSARS